MSCTFSVAHIHLHIFSCTFSVAHFHLHIFSCIFSAGYVKGLIIWKTTLLCSDNNGTLTRPVAFIDGKSGNIIDQWDAITDVKIDAVGGDISGGGSYFCLDVL